MNAAMQSKVDAINGMEAKLIETIDGILEEEGMKAFVLWAKAFPKRDLRFVSGMGTATFGCSTLDNSSFLLELDDYCEKNTRKVFWNDRAAAMVQPLTDFVELFWSFDIYKYPAINDIIYNPVTRTVECGSKIIHLDQQ
jgi:hypothetical protein